MTNVSQLFCHHLLRIWPPGREGTLMPSLKQHSSTAARISSAKNCKKQIKVDRYPPWLKTAACTEFTRLQLPAKPHSRVWETWKKNRFRLRYIAQLAAWLSLLLQRNWNSWILRVKKISRSTRNEINLKTRTGCSIFVGPSVCEQHDMAMCCNTTVLSRL